MCKQKPSKQHHASRTLVDMLAALQVYTLEQLTSVERQPTPLWSTFCGTSGGCWQGTVAAFSPTTGGGPPTSCPYMAHPANHVMTCTYFGSRNLLVDKFAPSP